MPTMMISIQIRLVILLIFIVKVISAFVINVI